MSPATQALLLVVLLPLLLAGLVAAGVQLLRAHRRGVARRAGLRAVQAAGQDPLTLASVTGHEDEEVRAAAATALLAAPAEGALRALEPLLATPGALEALAVQAGRPEARERATELLARAAQQPDEELAALAAERWAALDPAARVADPRPLVRFGLGRGLLRSADPPAGGELLLALLADPAVEADLRQEALDELDALPAPALREPAAARLAAEAVTPELLWLLAERGAPDEAPLLAARIGSDQFETARAALEAVRGVVARHPELGPAREATRQALAAAREALRAVHPPGDNLLADGLVEGIEALLARL